MSKVLVDRELLERIERCYMDGMSIYGECEEIRAILAQPAEVEGSVEMGSDAWMALHLLDRLDVSADEEPRVQQVEEIVRRMGAALSAVTAERDRLREERDSQQRMCIAEMEKVSQLRAEVEVLRKDAERYRWLRAASVRDHGHSVEYFDSEFDNALAAIGVDAIAAQGGE